MISFSFSELRYIFEALTESEQSPDYDYSSLLAVGFTPRDLLALKSILRQLKAAPSLDEREFLEQSEVTLIRKLGGLTLVRLAIGIDEGDFTSLLENKATDEHKALCLKYPAYLRYANAIKTSDGSAHNWLLNNITVEFADGLQLRSIPIPCEESVSIPSSDQEAALVGAALLSDRYQLIGYDARSSLMSLQCLRDNRVVTIEVRCLSSKLASNSHDAFCVENDVAPVLCDQKRKIVFFTEQIRRSLK